MNTLSPKQLWDRLLEINLVTGEMPPTVDQHAPWFVRVMLGFAGWIGALFMLGFVGASLSFIMRSSSASLIAGALVCSGAAAIFRFSQGKDFAIQFGLATSFAGQAMFIFGIMETFRWGSGFGYIAVAIFEAGLAAIVVNEIHRGATAFAAAVSLSLALSWYGIPHLAPALITAAVAVLWMHEFSWADKGSVLRPIGYSLVLAALYSNSTLFMRDTAWLLGRGGAHNPALSMISSWAGVLLTSAVFLYTTVRLAAREGFGINDRPARTALVAAAAIAIASFKAPGIATGLVIVLLGFANANRVLTGLGIFSLIIYLSIYYYQLQATLLIKSASLVATGIMLLVARIALGRLWPAVDHKGEHNA